jgi:hypothetical protein
MLVTPLSSSGSPVSSGFTSDKPGPLFKASVYNNKPHATSAASIVILAVVRKTALADNPRPPGCEKLTG